MTVKHSDLTDPNLHDLKGFGGASNDTIPSKNSSGNLEWIDSSSVSGPPGPQGPAGNINKVSVADIDDPSSELSSESGALGDVLTVYQDDDPAQFTHYGFDDSVTAADNSPYIVSGSGGKWVAIAGKYRNGDALVLGEITSTGDINVGGNVVVTGTVDGRDVATDGTKLDGIASGAEVNPDVIPQAEAEAGTATTERIWTAQRVAQAIAAQVVSFNPQNKFRIYEDWVTGNNDQDEMGAYGWRMTSSGIGNSTVRLTAESGHPGILRQIGGTASAARSVIYLGENGFNTIYPGGGIFFCEFIARLTGTVSTHERSLVGLADPITTNGPILNGIFMGIRNGDSNWHLTCANAGSETRLDTGIAFASGTWVRFRFTTDASWSTITCSINGTPIGGSITTNIPTAVLSPCSKTDALSAGGGTAIPWDTDYIWMEQELSR